MAKFFLLFVAVTAVTANPSLPEWVVKLSSTTGHGKDDGLKLQQALEGLGIVKVVSAGEDRVVLSVSTRSLDRGQVATLLTPHRLDFHLLAKEQAPLRPARAGIRGPPNVRAEADPDLGLVWLAGECGPLEPLGARAKIAPDQQVSCLCEDRPSLPRRCRLVLLEQDPMISGTSLSHAFPTLSKEGIADVSMSFDDEGRRLLAERTRSAVGRFVAIVLDGKTLIAPFMYEPIENGRLRMTVGTMKDTGTQFREVQAISVAISASMLKGHWTVDDVVRLPAKDEL